MSVGNSQPNRWLYVVFEGEPDAVEALVRSIGSHVEMTSTDAAFRIRVHDELPRLGLDVLDDRLCARIWFRLKNLDQQKKRIIETLRQSLGWRVKAYWGLASEDGVLPPFPGPLIRAREEAAALTYRRRTLRTFHMLDLLALGAIVVSHCLGSTPASLAVGSCLLVLVLAGARHLVGESSLTPMGLPKRQLALTAVELFLVALFASRGQTLPLPWSGERQVPWILVYLIGFLLLQPVVRRIWRPKVSDDLQNRILWKAASITEKRFLDRAAITCCIVCGRRLLDQETCRCPGCGTMNYYLLDRPDAHDLARSNGACL